VASKKKTKIIFSKSQAFLYILLFSFVFIASANYAIHLFKGAFEGDTLVAQEKLAVSANQLPPEPVLVSTSAYPALSAQAALAVDLESQATLYAKNSDLPLLPASTTKIVTSLVALDYYPLNMVLTVPRISVEGQKMKLLEGEEIKVEDLLYGLLVFSANDAAEVLAYNYPGGREVFIAAMNLKASELGLTKTVFTNPTGFDANDHKTTAKDLVKVAAIALKNPTFAKIVATREVTVSSVDGKIVHNLVNVNELLGVVEGVLGVKTGWTENARENLVTYIKRGERKVVLVVLGSQDRFGETKELINWIFRNYNWEE
jgi:serine-type D-Ala-D-Ala carboxypeptidase (penicillin-binding protein 5/6)